MAEYKWNDIKEVESDTTITASNIVVPSDIQAIYKYLLAETSTPLPASATYTGSSVETTTYTKLVGIVYSDQDGTLYIEQSIDGTNWDYADSASVTGGNAQPVDYIVRAKYVRARYVNGSTDQTIFRLQIYLSVL